MRIPPTIAAAIPAQPLPRALDEFATRTGLQVVYRSEVAAGVQSKGTGSGLSPEKALEQLLRDTGLRFEFINANTVAIRHEAQSVSSRPGVGELRMVQGGTEISSAPDASNDEPAQVQEIVVTAQKRIERLQDVPMSISVLTAESIEKRSLVSANDFLKYVPGVAYEEVSAGQNTFRIRGIGGSVGTYLGDMPIPTSADLKLVDVERVEVLRGPQGTLYGAGSMGGTIRYIPKLPDATQFGGDLDVGFVDTDHAGNVGKNVTGAINIPLVQDKLAVRIAGYYYETPGYIRYVGQTIPERVAFADAIGASYVNADDGGSSEFMGGRVTMLWKPLDHLNATLTYVNQRLTQSGAFEDNASLEPYHDFPLSLRGLTSDGRERRFNRSPLYNLLLNLDLDKFNLVSSTTYSDYSSGEARDVGRDLGIGSIGVALGADQRNVERSTTQELRFRSKFEVPLNFLLGFYYVDTTSGARGNYPWIGAPALCCSAYPELFDFGSDPDNLYNDGFRQTSKEKAIFSELYYDLYEKVRLTVGGRFYDYERLKNSFGDGVLNGGPTTGVDSTSESGATYKASVTYSPSRTSTLYLQWAQGFRPGSNQTPPPRSLCDVDNDGILDGTNAPIDTDHVDADTVDSWEVGSKSTLWGGRLGVNAALYRIYWDGIPTGVLSESCGLGLSLNAGKARSEGLELESTLALTSQVHVNIGASIFSGELTENATSLNAHKGDKLQAPPLQVNAGLEYRMSLFGHDGYVRGDYAYVDEYRVSYDPTHPLVAGYRKLDFRAGMYLGNITASVYGTNLTNEDALIGTGHPFPRSWHLQPRTIGVEFGYQF